MSSFSIPRLFREHRRAAIAGTIAVALVLAGGGTAGGIALYQRHISTSCAAAHESAVSLIDRNSTATAQFDQLNTSIAEDTYVAGFGDDEARAVVLSAATAARDSAVDTAGSTDLADAGCTNSAELEALQQRVSTATDQVSAFEQAVAALHQSVTDYRTSQVRSAAQSQIATSQAAIDAANGTAEYAATDEAVQLLAAAQTALDALKTASPDAETLTADADSTIALIDTARSTAQALSDSQAAWQKAKDEAAAAQAAAEAAAKAQAQAKSNTSGTSGSSSSSNSSNGTGRIRNPDGTYSGSGRLIGGWAGPPVTGGNEVTLSDDIVLYTYGCKNHPGSGMTYRESNGWTYETAVKDCNG